MKFQVNRDAFSEAVSFAVRLLAQRPTLPILSGVLISTSGSSLTLSSFDYEVSARNTIDAAVDVEGRVLVSGRMLSDIASKLPEETVTVTLDGNKVTVHSGASKFVLQTMPLEEYPKLPEIEGSRGLVKTEEFSDAISQVTIAASRDDVTPVITGVQLDFANNKLSLIATDRYRAAVREIDWDGENLDGATALVPFRTIQEVGKSFGSIGTVEVVIAGEEDRRYIAFVSDNKAVTSRLISGNFPPVKRLFPEDTDHYAVVNTQDLIAATRRVQTVLERDAALKFTFENNSVELDASSGELAQASEILDVQLVGENTVVSLKPQFLLDGLGAVHAEFTKIAFTKTENPNKSGPVLITAQSSNDVTNYRYLLQPKMLLR
ncbi:MAG: DNA polymerase III subunit beta [Microbacteriaceae bacterium]|nr:DNA polymerase III subunit beta [Microbacteriaceae bacterium]